MTLDIGIGTIIAGILTAVVHIFITLKAQKISQENLRSQRKLFETTKIVEYLNEKRKFLELRVEEMNIMKPNKKGKDFSEVAILIVQERIFLLSDIVKKSKHYFEQDELIEFENFKVKFIKIIAEGKTLTKNSDKSTLTKVINEYNEAIQEAPRNIELIESQFEMKLKMTINKIENIINAT